MEEKAQAILAKITYATLATVSAEGMPWNSPVFYAFDNALHLYWSSHPQSVHSQNITANGQVFIVVYDSTSAEAESVYMQCAAEVVKDELEVAHALELLGKRRGKPFKHREKFMDLGPQRIFRATLLKMWMNDADKDEDGDFVRDYRIEVQYKQ